MRAVYKGLTPTMLALLPTWALYFSTYEYLKGRLQSSEAGPLLARVPLLRPLAPMWSPGARPSHAAATTAPCRRQAPELRAVPAGVDRRWRPQRRGHEPAVGG